MSERRFTVAAVQSEPVWFDLEATTQKTLTLIAEAAAAGADLIAFPEVWLPGYPVFLWLGTDEWQADQREHYIANSAVHGGPEHVRIADAAAEHGIQVVLGLSERDDAGRIYMAQWIIDETGATVLARRKLKPSSVEGSFFAPGDPETNLVVTDTSIGTIGALNCSEHKRPMLRHVMYGLGEEIHVAAWPAFGLVPEVVTMGAKVNMGATSFYAAEGGMFVVAPTQVIGEEFAQRYSDTPERAGKISVGGGATHIFGPDGQDVVEPLAHDHDGILVAEIDLSRVRRIFDADPLAALPLP
ncbi:nitrilase-related carbon-nitrogen hydrolase [Microbacterium sp. 5K110]|jgi:aliphatic nitrilase|uniref:nitrilase-related carbon-nitrogen hydrolase n=1 Tax=unclassified Microbacterium TaxID=2609290 RepID=UPI0010FE91D5|nr:nitrilase-related carbon-nitrogen hydrolase [Microbacterium sp. 5K110]TLF32675.1 carbon-nitrogen hydrolase family protein [Microbacterium sp. 5K110]